MKSKRSKKELTSLILAAIILSNGSFYAPMAEANGTVTVDANETVNYVYNGVKSTNSSEPNPQDNDASCNL